jgi:hypothetical protein
MSSQRFYYLNLVFYFLSFLNTFSFSLIRVLNILGILLILKMKFDFLTLETILGLRSMISLDDKNKICVKFKKIYKNGDDKKQSFKIRTIRILDSFNGFLFNCRNIILKRLSLFMQVDIWS